MKWKANTNKPKVGDLRTRRKFAWFPVKYYINGEKWWCWLESYLVTEKYTKVANNESGLYTTWDFRWEVVSRDALFHEYEG